MLAVLRHARLPLRQVRRWKAGAALEGKKAKGGAQKSVEELYKALTPQQHVLQRPDMYIGSPRKHNIRTWVIDDPANMCQQAMKEIEVVPGLAKIFDEMLVNVADNFHRTKGTDRATTKMVVEINRETGVITILNNGRCVDVEWHKDSQAYCPELVFGHFQAGSNFDDAELRVTGGRNGIGAKATNVLSEFFRVEIGDARRSRLYRQEWSDSMKLKTEPEISDYASSAEYTKISFKPLYGYFGFPALNDSHFQLFLRRVADIAACCRGLDVYFNGNKVPIHGFFHYLQGKYEHSTPDASGWTKADVATTGSSVVGRYESSEGALFTTTIQDQRNKFEWEIGVGTRICEQISFVNSINTLKGGSHVAVITNKIVDALWHQIHAEHKYKVHKAVIRDSLSIFVNCQVGNPEFDGQTKERLTCPTLKALDSTITLPEEFVKSVSSCDGIVGPILSLWQSRLSIEAAKMEKKRAQKIVLPKLEDANFAGTERSRNCTLILTEGDSAKSLALAGLAALGRDYWGVFPLRGKVMNVLKKSESRIDQNSLLQQLQRVLGLEREKSYQTEAELSTLRYGSVALMCDQDLDGSHIKGLVLSWFNTYWPALLSKTVVRPSLELIPSKRKSSRAAAPPAGQVVPPTGPFLKQIVTPLVKAFGPGSHSEQWFFSLSELARWQRGVGRSAAKYTLKYYKGLGSSTSKEGRRYFEDLFCADRPLLIDFRRATPVDTARLNLAFDDGVFERRCWLNETKDKSLDTSQGSCTFRDFVDTELAAYFRYSNERALPSSADGLKPSQRKILFTCFERGLDRGGRPEVKVSQLSGAVMERSAYHHGETSLHDTIIKMSQDYAGCGNNVPLLEGVGQFGTRLTGGADHASPRYISTRVSALARKLFRVEDDSLLEYRSDDGKLVEPFHYLPVLPVVLVNGGAGIGTGYATNIPSHDPLQVVARMLELLLCKSEHDASVAYGKQLESAHGALEQAHLAFVARRQQIAASHGDAAAAHAKAARKPAKPPGKEKPGKPAKPGARGGKAKQPPPPPKHANPAAAQDEEEEKLAREYLRRLAEKTDEFAAVAAAQKEVAALQSAKKLVPWYHGHTANHGFCPDNVSNGIVTEETPTLDCISELPVAEWTDTFKDHLDALVHKKLVKSYTSACTDTLVNFRIAYAKNEKLKSAKLDVRRRLTRKIVSRFVFFTPPGVVREFNDTDEVILRFFPLRLKLYEKRLRAKRAELAAQKEKLSAFLRFIDLLRNGKLNLNRPKDELIRVLEGKCGIIDAEAFLNRTSILTCTRQSADKSKQALADVETQIAALSKKTARLLWVEDLLDFAATYVKHFGVSADELQVRLAGAPDTLRGHLHLGDAAHASTAKK
eukprot:gene16638-25523_t